MERVDLCFRPYREPPDEKHIDVLDGFRALMILLVGWFHIWQQSWLSPTLPMIGSLDFLLRAGYMGVDGMLLLSGFLLYLPWTGAGKAPGARAFYTRRLIRILPSYLFCVIPLFVISLIQGKYPSPLFAVKDLLAHLTFTHTLFRDTYFSSPLNGALWTVAVEMQFYLLFPLLARLFRKKPALTFLGMTGIAFAFRLFAFRQEDPSMYFNQLPAFLDVYALGFAAASGYAALRKALGARKWSGAVRWLFTALFALCLCQALAVLRGQAYDPAYGTVMKGQLARRFPFALAAAGMMVCAACAAPPLRFLLGNRLMRFLAGISFQFYIWHQLIAVQLKAWGFPPSASAAPWSAGEYTWQVTYTLLCFLTALAWAALTTYLFERPAARALRRKMNGSRR